MKLIKLDESERHDLIGHNEEDDFDLPARM